MDKEDNATNPTGTAPASTDNAPGAEPQADQAKPGLYALGHIISCSARAFRKRDGSGTTVKVETEIALQPGTIVWEEYINPAEDSRVQLNDQGEVIQFPQQPMFQMVYVKFKRFREYQKRLFVSDVELALI